MNMDAAGIYQWSVERGVYVGKGEGTPEQIARLPEERARNDRRTFLARQPRA